MATHILKNGHLDPNSFSTKQNQGVFRLASGNTALAVAAKQISEGILDGTLVSKVCQIQGYWNTSQTGNTVDITFEMQPGTVLDPHIAEVKAAGAVASSFSNKIKLTLLVTDQGTCGKVLLNTIHPIP